jgi:PAS domain-containing protein
LSRRLRSRPGLVITALLAVSLAVVRPLYQAHIGAGVPADGFYWPLHVCAALSLVGAWIISSLHSSTRDDMQSSLERAMRVLHESEGRLSSLIESTDDVVCSLDVQGRILTANSAMRRVYLAQFGQDLREGQDFLSLVPPGQPEAWRQHFAKVLSGQRERRSRPGRHLHLGAAGAGPRHLPLSGSGQAQDRDSPKERTVWVLSTQRGARLRRGPSASLISVTSGVGHGGAEAGSASMSPN